MGLKKKVDLGASTLHPEVHQTVMFLCLNNLFELSNINFKIETLEDLQGYTNLNWELLKNDFSSWELESIGLFKSNGLKEDVAKLEVGYLKFLLTGRMGLTLK